MNDSQDDRENLSGLYDEEEWKSVQSMKYETLADIDNSKYKEDENENK